VPLGSGADDADVVGQGVASGDVVGLGGVDAGQRWCGGEGGQVGVLVAEGEERQVGEVGEGCQVGVVADLEELEVGEVGQGGERGEVVDLGQAGQAEAGEAGEVAEGSAARVGDSGSQAASAT
jgi:hypothetical protein